MKSRIDRQPYQQPDLDSIEELNYISTIEEDEDIDRHIDTLREWGYGSISHVHDLHQLFWEFTRRAIILDKLFRVAVVECIDEEPLYTKFLGMVKRYSGWAQKQITQEAKQKKADNKELSERKAEIQELKESLKIANASITKLEKEKEELVKAQKPKKAGAKDSFQLAWKCARPNAIVTVVALYDEPQLLPLPDMYGKNLTFKSTFTTSFLCS